MEWSVVDALQAKGQLPNLKALRARGVEAKMGTDYEARSPVVWTTILTGMNPEVHGIEDFAVSTPKGPAAVTSTLRKVPALWTMANKSGLRTAVMGFWATFPAEDINGIVLSDRAAQATTGKVISPESYRPTYITELGKANADRSLFPDDRWIGDTDRMVAHFAPLLVQQDFDLTLAYLRGIDVISHEYWKYWDPTDFPAIPPEEMAKYQDYIPSKYRAMDAVIGRVLAVTPKNTNVLVVSDHGFRSLHPEIIMVRVSLSTVLQRAGLLVNDDKGAPDMAKSTVFGFQAQDHRTIKFVRFPMAGRDAGGTLTPETVPAARAKLVAELAKFTWDDGKSPVFLVRDMTAAEKADVGTSGADVAVMVVQEHATQDVLYQGEKVPGVVGELTLRSGVHKTNPPAIFIAAGPDIDKKADLTGIRVHDVTPTILYGLGLPVGADMNGQARTALYTKAFQDAHPLTTIPSWGQGADGKVMKTDSDDAYMDQLRKLGYVE